MNKELIIKLRNQAIDNVCNKRKLSDGQVERTWLQDDFDIEFARLVANECAVSGFNTAYDVCSDTIAVAVYQNIKKHFGVKE